MVELAVVAKKLVEVAEVVVAFTPVKFWRVEEAVTKSPAKELAPVKALLSVKRVVEAVLSVLVTQENLPPVQRKD